MITSGVNVLVIGNLDSGTGKAVLDKAKTQGVAMPGCGVPAADAAGEPAWAGTRW
ncbi:hypothetical protein [Kitasatospora sp. NPDC059827]|uniref:hypothetical protein n=1 Tax=Kitasatospora sp. NPDC059827 TaxID=3346964 RepID=UPI00364980DB